MLRAGVTCNVQSEVLTKGEVIFMTSLNLKLLNLPPLGKGSKKYIGEWLNKSCINVYTDEFCFILPENRKVLEDSTRSILNLR